MCQHYAGCTDKEVGPWNTSIRAPKGTIHPRATVPGHDVVISRMSVKNKDSLVLNTWIEELFYMSLVQRIQNCIMLKLLETC